MTVTEAIAQANALRPGNPYTDAQKRAWLTALDGRIWLEVQQGDPDGAPVYPVPAEGEEEPELLAPAPYDRLYPAWLIAQVDFADLEWEAYAVSARVYNGLFEDYAKYWLRQHRPAGRPVIY